MSNISAGEIFIDLHLGTSVGFPATPYYAEIRFIAPPANSPACNIPRNVPRASASDTRPDKFSPAPVKPTYRPLEAATILDEMQHLIC
ncbi:hypothetical protein VC83_01892 [Pseudogymnoascus destructans]|uniref:Uncharacterized protein n=1 Tax=Pseudogymnoascus destructans TaxID=655981 RepID=A0A177AGU0_9PEZI|nr:uncharacterized protein VC83_01892 [Pseudogymnoascus destructans]OAF61326.1 hypothetical protein VC83_01892 [Pseudogymnoascus destructans]